MFPVVMLITLFVLMIDLVSQLLFKGEDAAYKFIKAILEEHKYCKKYHERSIQ